jgi:hypothetical protein
VVTAGNRRRGCLVVVLLFAFALLNAASAQTVDDNPAVKIRKLGVSPKKLSFGVLPPLMPGLPKVLTIHNPNSMAIEITSITSSSPQFVPSANCVGSPAAGNDCVVSIVFTPTSDGKESGKLMIANGASSKPLSVSMKGEGKGSSTVTYASWPTPAVIVS